MAELTIQVENIKCGGCAGTITRKMSELPGVTSVDVDIEDGLVKIGGDNLQREQLTHRLESLGYPETGSVAGIKAAKARAVSVVSCAIGRIDRR